MTTCSFNVWFFKKNPTDAFMYKTVTCFTVKTCTWTLGIRVHSDLWYVMERCAFFEEAAILETHGIDVQSPGGHSNSDEIDGNDFSEPGAEPGLGTVRTAFHCTLHKEWLRTFAASAVPVSSALTPTIKDKQKKMWIHFFVKRGQWF